ncbi:hypothetical protein ACFP2F_23185 [Hymenobacter artigasi]|uniref:Uncharacterized protein n=1 Tax=Hymenobacter artigasi TaxID=2719616 RepID=A0ABX1HL71_9BACT|nr:hypothetical protein [Hymenobacter artigasi]NKI91009.1 hypothetical protein [Hymenobacter artigasi]
MDHLLNPPGHFTAAKLAVPAALQGQRVLRFENVRLSNVADGYAVNGWESMMLKNHSGIAGNYRNPKGASSPCA